MIGLRIDKSRTFFDSPTVLERVDAANRKSLSEGGAYIRTTARRSIRSRRGASKPGTPPRSHKGLLKNKIFFSYDDAIHGVVVGPELLGVSNALEALEVGGSFTRGVFAPRQRVASPKQSRSFLKRVRAGQIQPPVRTRTLQTVVYPKRAFMKPSLDQEIPKLSRRWAGKVSQ